MLCWESQNCRRHIYRSRTVLKDSSLKKKTFKERLKEHSRRVQTGSASRQTPQILIWWDQKFVSHVYPGCSLSVLYPYPDLSEIIWWHEEDQFNIRQVVSELHLTISSHRSSITFFSVSLDNIPSSNSGLLSCCDTSPSLYNSLCGLSVSVSRLQFSVWNDWPSLEACFCSCMGTESSRKGKLGRFQVKPRCSKLISLSMAKARSTSSFTSASIINRIFSKFMASTFAKCLDKEKKEKCEENDHG